MTNISKQKLKPAEQKKLHQQLTHLLAQVDDSGAKSLVGELFTESEQIMFMKRLAMIIMIDKGYSTYRIAKTLKVSDSTVRNIQQSYDFGRYTGLSRIVHSKQFDSEQFWQSIEVLLRLGMPSMGKDRWKALRGL